MKNKGPKIFAFLLAFILGVIFFALIQITTIKALNLKTGEDVKIRTVLWGLYSFRDRKYSSLKHDLSNLWDEDENDKWITYYTKNLEQTIKTPQQKVVIHGELFQFEFVIIKLLNSGFLNDQQVRNIINSLPHSTSVSSKVIDWSLVINYANDLIKKTNMPPEEQKVILRKLNGTPIDIISGLMLLESGRTSSQTSHPEPHDQ